MSMEIAKRIKEAREKSNKSISRISEDTGITRATIYKWEDTGLIRDDHLKSFCEAVDESPAFIKYGIKEAPVDGIDRDRLKLCFAAVKQAAKNLKIELSEEQTINAALHLYEGKEEVEEEATRLVTIFA